MRLLLTQLLLPPAGPLLLTLVGLLGWRRAWGRWLAAGGLLLSWLLCLPVVVEPLTRVYIGDHAPADLPARAQAWRDDKRSAVLVLGGGIKDRAGARGDHELTPITAERLRRGLWWSRQLGLPLAFSGGTATRAEPGTPSEAALAQRTLDDLGLPPLAWSESESTDTRSNARLSAPLLRQHGVRRLLLVTSDLHMPRAIAHFRRELPELELIPAPLSQQPGVGRRLGDFLPNADAARRAAYLSYELTARLVGH
ncbi:MAG: YdcF family protein [Inhella sp.]